jgi:3-hydroxyacyl-[acyl-carrier-protein] dehydratase
MTETDLSFITRRIPHRPPFLWLDRVVELTESEIRAETWLDPDLDVFGGHYPGQPIMPGVLLCESVFQAGALLIAETATEEELADGVPVLARIQGARFKRPVGPGDTIAIRARILEKVGPAWFLKGSVRQKGKMAVQVEFSCTMGKVRYDEY